MRYKIMRACPDSRIDCCVHYITPLDEQVHIKKGFFMDCDRTNLHVSFKRLQEVEVENKS